MAENHSDPNPDPAPASLPVKLKKRRLWFKVCLGILALLILLVLLIPTILSTSAGRSIVLGQVNKNLRGRVEAADWSIGWTGGIDARGIKVFDDGGKPIAEIGHLSTELPLTKAMFGSLPLGKVKIDGVKFNVVVDESNQLNFAKLTKPSPDTTREKPASGSAKLPDISADVEISNVSGTFEQPGKPLVNITQVGGSIKVPGINQPITNDLSMGVKVGDGPEGHITSSGTADVIKDNQLALGTANARQTIDARDIDLAAALPFLSGMGIEKFSGATGAHFALEVKDGKSVSLDMSVDSKSVVVAGRALKGDTFATQSFTASVPKLTAVFPDGLDKWQSGRIKVGADGSPPIDVAFDQGRLTVAIDVVPQAMLNVMENKKPGSTGLVKLEQSIDVGKLARQMKNIFHVADDATVTGGAIKNTVTLRIADDKADLSATADVIGVRGERAGKPLALQQIHMAMGASDQGGGGTVPDLRDLSLEMTSGFANGKFSGKSVADLSGSIKGELQKLQSELGQFVDFGGKQWGGGFDIAINNRGDLTVANGTANLDARATLTNLKVGEEVNQPWVEAKLVGDLHHGEKTFVDSVKNLLVTLQTNNAKSPTVDVSATANADLAGEPKVDFKLTRANIDFARTQAEFGRFIPALGANGIVLTGGNLSATASGAYDGASKKVAVNEFALAANRATIQKQIDGGTRGDVLRDYTLNLNTSANADLSNGLALRVVKLSISDSQQMLAVQKPGDELVVNRSPNGAISGSGQVTVNADLGRVNAVLKSLSNTQAVAKARGGGEITSGNFALKLVLAPGDSGQTTINGDGDVTGLRLTTATGQTEQPESMKITLRAAASPEAIAAKQLSVSSRFANVDVTDAHVQLSKPGGAAVGMLDMLQKAKLAIDVPDLNLTKSFLDAFSSPATVTESKSASTEALLPPLQVTSGSLSMRADVGHEGSSLLLNVSDISGKGIAFRRGDVAYQAKPFDVQLVAVVDAASISGATTQQLSKVQVTKLSGNLGVATLSMPTPIVITDLSSARTSASGAVKIDGRVQDVTDLLAALQAKKGDAYPYRGDFAVTQAVGSGQGGLSLSGGVQVSKFQVLRGSEVAFSENELSIANDVSLSADENALAIKNLSVNMQSSGALNLSVQNGRIEDLKGARQMNLGLDLQYDLGKLWPIVHPMLVTPGQEDGYKETRVAGQYKKSFHVTGQYPAGLPFNQAVRALIADGSIAVALLDHNGLKVENLELPLTLRDGKATTVYADKPAGANTAAAATANEGQLDLGNITLDMTQEVMRVSTPPNKPLLTHATVNPLFARTYLAKIINNPVFVGAREATGLIDVSIVQCEQMPLSDLVLKRVAQNNGRATIKMSLTNLHIGSDLVGKLLQAINEGAKASFEADVKDATVAFAGGIATQHIDFQSGTLNFGFDGNVALDTKELMPLTIKVPGAAIARRFTRDPNVLNKVPKQVSVVMSGFLTAPQVQWDQAAQKLAAEVAPSLIEDLITKQLNKNKDKKKDGQAGGDGSAGKQDQKPAANDPLGGLLDQLKKEQERRQQPKPQPQRPAGGASPASPGAPASQPAAQPVPPPGANDPLGGFLDKLKKEQQEREQRRQEQERQRQQQQRQQPPPPR